jgi:hypothetical protein
MPSTSSAAASSRRLAANSSSWQSSTPLYTLSGLPERSTAALQQLGASRGEREELRAHVQLAQCAVDQFAGL